MADDRPARGQEPRGAQDPGNAWASTVNRLIRISFGPFQLLDLKPGDGRARASGACCASSSARQAAAELGIADGRGDAPARRASRHRPSQRAGHEDRRRPVPRARRSPRRATTARARPPTACARRCSTSWRTASPDFALEGVQGARPVRRHRRARPRGAVARRGLLPVRRGGCARRAALIRRNVEAFGLTGVTKIFRRDATDLGAARPNGLLAGLPRSALRPRAWPNARWPRPPRRLAGRRAPSPSSRSARARPSPCPCIHLPSTSAPGATRKCCSPASPAAEP